VGTMRTRWWLVSIWSALLLLAKAEQPSCDAVGDSTVLRLRGAELYASGNWGSADACISSALVKVTEELELLATHADALRRFRDARKAAPTSAPALTGGCVVDATGASVCLPELKQAPVAPRQVPQSVEECGSEQTALALLQQQLLQPPPPSDAVATTDDESASSFYDAYIMHSAQRHWWAAAKKGVDELRKQNAPPSSETRRALTELRDEAGSLLALLRQTKMDEATISCAIMWAQGERTLHLNVKFAGRLDAPVTVLNVDNEVVNINATHVSFTGVGRQKPKRYVVDLELFEQIDPARSSWSFGSVGTVRFVLRKASDGPWARLTLSNETVKHHRVWWEKQEQVEKDDRNQKEGEERKAREAKAEEERKAKEEAAATAEAKAAEERAKTHAERLAKRLEQKPSYDAALAAFDTFAAAPKEGVDAAMVGALEAAMEVLRVTGQDANETASATAQQMLNAMKTLRSTGFADLTQEASTDLTTKYKGWLEEQIEPDPEPLPGAKKEKKKKAKKKAKAKAA